jgi:hypothetical protein
VRYLDEQLGMVQLFSVGWQNEAKLINSFKRSSGSSDITDFRRRVGSVPLEAAGVRGLGGSAPKRRGGSPFSTQRQNFRSAVTIRCW